MMRLLLLLLRLMVAARAPLASSSGSAPAAAGSHVKWLTMFDWDPAGCALRTSHVDRDVYSEKSIGQHASRVIQF
jgi:hypothetical protein